MVQHDCTVMCLICAKQEVTVAEKTFKVWLHVCPIIIVVTLNGKIAHTHALNRNTTRKTEK